MKKPLSVAGYRLSVGRARSVESGPSTSLGMTAPRAVLATVVVLLLSGLALAQTITGTVTNGTTGKPAAGDEVALLALSQGMQEIASTKTDAQGKFSFAAPADQQAPHMVRVTHEGVRYFPQGGPLMPGATSAQVTVYDVAKKVDGLSQTVEVDRYQSEDGNQLQVIALFAVQNKSNPPRTVDNDRTFEFILPAGAQMQVAAVKGPGGQPVNTSPAETRQNHYAFNFPLKPGETQFQIQYQLPYEGQASFTPKLLGDVQHFVVMTPKGITFSAANAQQFQPMDDQSGATIMVASNVKPGQDLSFKLSGTGVFQPEGQQGAAEQGGSAMGSQAAANDNRPGGGLGAPLDVPDPLHNYRAVILGAFAVVLVMGGFYIATQSNHRKSVPMAAGNAGPDASPMAAAKDRSAMLLEALKEELFQLELDRQQGKIDGEEYAKSKSALDETIRRALARKQ